MSQAKTMRDDVGGGLEYTIATLNASPEAELSFAVIIEKCPLALAKGSHVYRLFNLYPHPA